MPLSDLLSHHADNNKLPPNKHLRHPRAMLSANGDANIRFSADAAAGSVATPRRFRAHGAA
ncbi:MAG: hypothetical protein JOY51_06540 [Nevskia sp.]|nr:hypothetical protein [Nevskia sp.]